MTAKATKRNQSRPTAGPLRIDQGDLKILRPSIEAIELWALFKKPDDFIARMLRASRQYKFERTTTDKASIRELCGRKGMPPGERECQIGTILSQSHQEQFRRWRLDREEAKRWCSLVKLYIQQRDHFKRLPEDGRQAEAAKLEAEFNRRNWEALQHEAKAKNRAAKDEVRARSKERTVERQQNIEIDRRLRKFGRRKRGDTRTRWVQHAPDVCNPERYYLQDYLPAARRLWANEYAYRPALRDSNPAKVRKEVLRGHPLAQPTRQEEWAEAGKVDVLKVINKNGLTNTHIDDLEPIQAIMASDRAERPIKDTND